MTQNRSYASAQNHRAQIPKVTCVWTICTQYYLGVIHCGSSQKISQVFYMQYSFVVCKNDLIHLWQLKTILLSPGIFIKNLQYVAINSLREIRKK